MKKCIKLLTFAAAILGAAALKNHIIFKYAGVPLNSKFPSKRHKWKFGDINYFEVGTGKPLLLIHGLGCGCSLHEWEEQAQLLSHSYHVYALDLLGFGDSDKPQLSYSAYLYASLLNDFVRDVIKEETYAIASNSSSGFLIAASVFSPELYKKLILVSPTGFETDSPSPNKHSLFIRNLIELPIVGTSIYNIISSFTFSKYFLRKYCYAGASNDLVKKYYNSAHCGGVGAKFPIAAFISGYFNINNLDLVSRCKVPVSIFCGKETEFYPGSNNPALDLFTCETEIFEFEDSMLMPHRNEVKKFFRAVKETL